MTPAATMPPGTKWPPAAFEGGEGGEVVEGVLEALFVMAAVSSSVVVGSVVVDSSEEVVGSAPGVVKKGGKPLSSSSDDVVASLVEVGTVRVGLVKSKSSSVVVVREPVAVAVAVAVMSSSSPIELPPDPDPSQTLPTGQQVSSAIQVPKSGQYVWPLSQQVPWKGMQRSPHSVSPTSQVAGPPLPVHVFPIGQHAVGVQ